MYQLTEQDIANLNEVVPALDKKGKPLSAKELSFLHRLITHAKYRMRHSTNDALSYEHQGQTAILNQAQDLFAHLGELVENL